MASNPVVIEITTDSEDENNNKPSDKSFHQVLDTIAYNNEFLFPEIGTIVYTSFENALLAVIIENADQYNTISLEDLINKSIGTWYIDFNLDYRQITQLVLQIELSKQSFKKFNFIQITKNEISTELLKIPQHFYFKYNKNHRSLKSIINFALQTNEKYIDADVNVLCKDLYGKYFYDGLLSTSLISGSLKPIIKYLVSISPNYSLNRKNIERRDANLVVYDDEEMQELYNLVKTYNRFEPMYYVDLMNLAHYYALFLYITDAEEFMKMFLSQENTFRYNNFIGFKRHSSSSTEKYEIEHPEINKKIIECFPRFSLEDINIADIKTDDLVNNPAIYHIPQNNYVIIPDQFFIACYGPLFINDFAVKITNQMIETGNYEITDNFIKNCENLIIPADSKALSQIKDIDNDRLYEYLTGMMTIPDEEQNSDESNKSDKDSDYVDKSNKYDEDSAYADKSKEADKDLSDDDMFGSKPKRTRKKKVTKLKPSKTPKKLLNRAFIIPFDYMKRIFPEPKIDNAVDCLKPMLVQYPMQDELSLFVKYSDNKKIVEITETQNQITDENTERRKPTLIEALRELKEKNKFSVDWAIKHLYPLYGQNMQIDIFIKQVWKTLGILEIQKK